MMSVVLIPISKDKKAKISSIDNCILLSERNYW